MVSIAIQLDSIFICFKRSRGSSFLLCCSQSIKIRDTTLCEPYSRCNSTSCNICPLPPLISRLRWFFVGAHQASSTVATRKFKALRNLCRTVSSRYVGCIAQIAISSVAHKIDYIRGQLRPWRVTDPLRDNPHLLRTRTSRR